MPERIRQRVPNAFVRGVGNTTGYGMAANEVLRLVEGDNGFFCFLHDDVALDPGAIRVLVEELYRSNAGIVGSQAGLVGRRRRLAACRPRRRPFRRDRLLRRGRRGRPGATRCGSRRVRPALGLHDGPRRPVPGDRRVRHGHGLLRRRRRPVLASTPRRRQSGRRAGGACPPPRGTRRRGAPICGPLCCKRATGCARLRRSPEPAGFHCCRSN